MSTGIACNAHIPCVILRRAFVIVILFVIATLIATQTLHEIEEDKFTFTYSPKIMSGFYRICRRFARGARKRCSKFSHFVSKHCCCCSVTNVQVELSIDLDTDLTSQPPAFEADLTSPVPCLNANTTFANLLSQFVRTILLLGFTDDSNLRAPFQQPLQALSLVPYVEPKDISANIVQLISIIRTLFGLLGLLPWTCTPAIMAQPVNDNKHIPIRKMIISQNAQCVIREWKRILWFSNSRDHSQSGKLTSLPLIKRYIFDRLDMTSQYLSSIQATCLNNDLVKCDILTPLTKLVNSYGSDQITTLAQILPTLTVNVAFNMDKTPSLSLVKKQADVTIYDLGPAVMLSPFLIIQKITHDIRKTALLTLLMKPLADVKIYDLDIDYMPSSSISVLKHTDSVNDKTTVLTSLMKPLADVKIYDLDPAYRPSPSENVNTYYSDQIGMEYLYRLPFKATACLVAYKIAITTRPKFLPHVDVSIYNLGPAAMPPLSLSLLNASKNDARYYAGCKTDVLATLASVMKSEDDNSYDPGVTKFIPLIKANENVNCHDIGMATLTRSTLLPILTDSPVNGLGQNGRTTFKSPTKVLDSDKSLDSLLSSDVISYNELQIVILGDLYLEDGDQVQLDQASFGEVLLKPRTDSEDSFDDLEPYYISDANKKRDEFLDSRKAQVLMFLSEETRSFPYAYRKLNEGRCFYPQRRICAEYIDYPTRFMSVTLFKAIAFKEPRLTVFDGLCIALDVAKAVKTIQKYNLVHTDLCTRNILLYQDHGQRWCAKIADFGSICPIGTPVESQRRGNAATEEAVAPELHHPCSELTYTFASEIYSIGFILWNMGHRLRMRVLCDISEPCLRVDPLQRPLICNLIQLLNSKIIFFLK